VIPPEANASFVAAMEDVLETYQRPRDADRPLVCLDETSKQLIAETRAPIPAKPGQPARYAYEYERNGVANLFMMFAPLEGWRRVEVTDHHAAVDYATVLPGRRGCCHPRPPQTRTRPFRAYGSSRERFVPSGVAVDDPDRWQRVSVEERAECGPCEPLSPCPAFQPLAPRPRDLVAILLQPSNIPRDAVVGVVSNERRRQLGMLDVHRLVPVGPAPVLDFAQRAGKPAFGRCLPHHVVASP